NMTEEELRRRFRPEVVGRFDEVITFHDMDLDKMRGVAATVFEPIRVRMLDNGVDVKLSQAALDQLARLATEDDLGARRLNRAIEREIVNPLARAKNRDMLPTDQAVEVDFQDGEFKFSGVCAKAMERIADGD
ncbi:MAG: ATP-dependent Clp protease ATP-binding subunit, partial [Bdellovibrionales bacterium]|nr:ATP-dependent Clp protease ATP-binding subunit [Bdellovibrionales bacterium]